MNEAIGAAVKPGGPAPFQRYKGGSAYRKMNLAKEDLIEEGLPENDELTKLELDA